MGVFQLVVIDENLHRIESHNEAIWMLLIFIFSALLTPHFFPRYFFHKFHLLFVLYCAYYLTVFVASSHMKRLLDSHVTMFPFIGIPVSTG